VRACYVSRTLFKGSPKAPNPTPEEP
jgi:hypothetical protein